MPVTGLYYLHEAASPRFPNLLHLLQDRIFKTYHPVMTLRWHLEHRLLREILLPPTTTTTTTPTPTSTAAAATASPTTAAPPPSPTPPQPRFMQFLELSQYPSRLFVLCDRALITIDRDFRALVKAKLSTLWTYRQTLKAEGVEYAIADGDFRVRVGRVTLGDQVKKGVVVEIEYALCADMLVGEGVIRDFAEGLMAGMPEGTGGKWVFDVERAGDRTEWGIEDTGRQYCELLRFR